MSVSIHNNTNQDIYIYNGNASEIKNMLKNNSITLEAIRGEIYAGESKNMKFGDSGAIYLEIETKDGKKLWKGIAPLNTRVPIVLDNNNNLSYENFTLPPYKNRDYKKWIISAIIVVIIISYVIRSGVANNIIRTKYKK